ncbi:hypothetical protein HanIR_Chr14g0712381 [Helianthus annuus]|nr:hypothetical protein HanIR_Chr14g0712381 [Helianthus annuus]
MLELLCFIPEHSRSIPSLLGPFPKIQAFAINALTFKRSSHCSQRTWLRDRN